MARRSARKVHAGLLHRFLGKESFMEFLKLQCIMTGSPRDVVKRVDLSRAYRRFCSARRLPAASMVNIGRHLGSQHVWASKRLGGANGRNQEYAYVGLSLKDAPDEEVKEEQPSCPPTPATPATSPPPLPPSLFWEVSQQQTVDWFSPSSKPLKISLSPPSSEDAMRLFDTFLQDHVECTGSAEDAVSIEELHKAYRRLCRSKGITPPSFSKLKTRCLTQRENISISSIPFQSVKRAYTGLRWTNSALQSLNPSRRVQPKPCSSCQAKNQAPAAPVVLCEMNQEGNDWIPLVRIDSTADQSSLRYWGDEDSSTFINTLVSPSTLLPAPASPPTPPETQDSSDLFQMLDMFDSTDLCMF